MTTSYYPRADLTEHANCIIFALSSGPHYDCWDKVSLPLIGFGLNSAVSSRTGASPVMLTYGWTPRPPAAIAADHAFANPMAETFAQACFDAAKDYIAMAQPKLIELMRRRRAPVTLAPGDLFG